MSNTELEELIRKEENTLCALPYEPAYKERRRTLTDQVNLHRDMLVNQITTSL